MDDPPVRHFSLTDVYYTEKKKVVKGFSLTTCNLSGIILKKYAISFPG